MRRRATLLLATILALLATLAAAGAVDEALGGAGRDGSVPAWMAGGLGVSIHTLPTWVPFGGVAVGRHLFLKRSQQRPFGVEHELIHARQQAAHPVWFWASYLLLPRWRLRWEAEAYAANARARCPIEGEHGAAAYLSGPAYLWPGSRAVAAAEIRRFL
jgi:hypothetical protein